MVLQIIFDAIKAVILFVVSLFPSLPKWDWIAVAIAPLYKLLQYASWVVDLRVVSACLIAILAVYNARLIWSIIVWAVRKIPGIS